MQNAVRAVVLGIVLVGLSAAPAAAGRYNRSGLFQAGDDILPLGEVDAALAGRLGLGKLGWHYERFAIIGLDLWRWDGEPCVYSGDQYIVLSDEEAALVGSPRGPLRYRLPPGLLLALGLVELGIMTYKRRPLKVTLSAGAALGVLTLLLWLGGMTWELIIPGGLALFHILGSYIALAHEDVIDANQEATTVGATDEPAPVREPAPRLPPPPRVETDPFRAPPQAPPIRVVRPDTAPLAAPVVVDPAAEKPKLLA